ncbi:MAG: hypothetical protein A2234_03435 [Elusimicrobia bacterium RIFOXYA2_FULL_58_8]|nr:MAG: hypothetical protein A2234_03435 [Elusimicrobia bacterium RIFOXYA2_FULL_58_8]
MTEQAIIYTALALFAVWLARLTAHYLRRSGGDAMPTTGSRLAELGITAPLRDFYRLAVLIEEEGRDFYLRLAAQALNPDTRKLCSSLAEEEAVHKNLFQDQLNRWRSLPANPAQWHVFLEQAKQAGIFEDFPGDKAAEEEMARFAIRQERKTAEFYGHFETAFPDAWRTARMRELVEEERSHENRLRAAYPQVS